MTAFRVLILSLAFPIVFGTSHSHGAETVIVNKALNGREIKVRAGATVQIELEQLGAAGYVWDIQNLDSEHFKVLSVKTGGRKGSEDLVGGPIMKTWRIRAMKAGKANLKILHYRPWEGEKGAADTFLLEVRILGTK